MNFKEKTFVEYCKFLRNFYNKNSEEYEQYYKHCRLGQAFCNTFNIHSPEIFYSEGDHIEGIIGDIVANTFIFPSDNCD